tara:strand:- start:7481 stop:8467 length:987 start_codon:yes stop_codon:yes gene_type:complete
MASSAIFHPTSGADAVGPRWLARLKALGARVLSSERAANDGAAGDDRPEPKDDAEVPGRSAQPGGDPALRDLLADMRAASPEDGPPPPVPDDSEVVPESDEPCQRFGLAVDEGGEFLVLTGPSICVGHASAGRADLPILADLEPRHLTITRRTSFHSGASWVASPCGQARVAIDGRRVVGSASLTDGAELRLAGGVSMRFREPDPGSGSACLDLGGGLEAEGAARVLLLAPGEGGRVRIGPRTDRHVPVAGLDRDVVLCETGGRLRVQCDGGVRIPGRDESQAEMVLDLPPPERVDLWAGVRDHAGFPYTISIWPIDPTISRSREATD